MVIEWGYVCATSSRFEVLREGQMTRWFRVYVVNQIERFLQRHAEFTRSPIDVLWWGRQRSENPCCHNGLSVGAGTVKLSQDFGLKAE